MQLAALAQANPLSCQSSLICQVDKYQFRLDFESPSDECTEDDMDIVFVQKDVKTKLGLPKGWLSALDDVGNGKGICQVEGKDQAAAPVFSISKSQILIFFWQSGRPSYDWVGVALYDILKKQLLDVKPRLGELKGLPTAILKTPTGFKLRLVKEYLKEVKCDCAAAAVDEWLEVFVQKGKISTRWL